MTAIATSPPDHPVRPLSPSEFRPALVSVGTIVWLASELMFFSGLFAAYLTLRASTKVWPPAGYQLDPRSVGVATVILILSSGTMQLAVRRTKLHDVYGFRAWLFLSFALGAIFDGMQVADYMGRNFSISGAAYGGCFYILTGIHALHVFGGLVGMVIMWFRSYNQKIRFGGHRSLPAVEMLSYYWHFVDVVWIALYAMIFLLK